MNGVKHDYCFRECIQSMLRVCNEVVVGYSDSPDGVDDGTRDALNGIDSRVRVIDHTEWMHSNQTGHRWFVEWMNQVRKSLRHATQLWLDADEVLSDFAVVSHETPTIFRRLNFWKDTSHLCPEGVVCASSVTRSGPSSYWMPSDDPNMKPGEERIIRESIYSDNPPEIFHYGFLRKPEAFLTKSRFFQPVLIGEYDKRLQAAELDTSKHWTEFAPFDKPLIQIQRKHPEVARQWLTDRGYQP